MAWVFRPDEAVHDVDAGFFEHAGPFDVRLLVEARFELDERDDLLALARGADERADDGAVGPGGSVDRLLDREHARVLRGLLDERLDRRGERVVRVMHEHVALLEDAEHIGAARRWAGARAGVCGVHDLVLELGTIEAVEAPEPAEVEGPVDHGDRGFVDLELALQDLVHRVGHGGVDLEPHHAPELRAAVQHLLDRFQEIFVFVLELEVGVAGDAERMVRDDVHPGEQTVEVRGDDLLDRHEPGVVGERDEAGQDRRHLHAREAVFAGLRIAARPPRGSATGSRCTGTGCAGSTASGVSTGNIWASNTAASSARSAGPSSSQLAKRMPASSSAGATSLLNDAGVAGDELVGVRPDRAELLAGVEAVGRAGADAGVELLLEARDADLEVLVEVLGEDGEELGPLEQRLLRVLREREHPRVEVEPRELSVQEPQRIPRRIGLNRCRRTGSAGAVYPSATNPSYRWRDTKRPG